MEFYHSLQPIQELLGEMTGLERSTMRLEARDTTTITTTTTATPTLTADQYQPKKRMEKDTISTTELNNNKNNNNKINDNPVKADNNHILGPSNHLLEQQQATAEVEHWEKEGCRKAIDKYNRNDNHLNVNNNDWNMTKNTGITKGTKASTTTTTKRT